MDKVKLNERMFRILFNDGKSLLVDVNESSWEEILKQKNKIIRIVANEWTWDLLTNEVTFN